MYKAVDLLKGLERAWNEIHLDGDMDLAKLVTEIDLLHQIQCEQVMQFYESWIDDENMALVFITELMTSGSLRRSRYSSPFSFLISFEKPCHFHIRVESLIV